MATNWGTLQERKREFEDAMNVICLECYVVQDCEKCIVGEIWNNLCSAVEKESKEEGL